MSLELDALIFAAAILLAFGIDHCLGEPRPVAASFMARLRLEVSRTPSPNSGWPMAVTNFCCPELDQSTQQQIDKLAQQSFTLKAQSGHLLEAAKRAVEIAIEQDEAAGMAYLSREGSLT